MNNVRTVAIVPARGGSKGLTRKNMRLLGGVPLIGHTLTAAAAARDVAQVFVTTDSEEIAEYSATRGASMLLQPPHVSHDSAPSIEAVRWALTQITDLTRDDLVMVLRATTPLRSAYDIDSAVQLFNDTPEADSLVSVVSAVEYGPRRLKRILPGGWVEDVEPEGYSPVRRQELAPYFVRNGGIYIARKRVVDSHGLWGARCIAYEMPRERSVNINSEVDLLLAEALLSTAREKGA